MADTLQIVLTGASRGLGRAMTRGLAARGHVVHGCCTSVAAAEQLASEFPAPHSFARVDVADDSQVRRWAERVLAAAGAPDLVLNNAAVVNASAPLWSVPPEEFSRLIDVNVKGVYHIVRAFAPAMIARGKGVIVNFSSGWGRSTSPEVAPYCASKYAVEGLTAALAQELPPGMAAVALNPGIIHTDMLASAFGEGAANYIRPDAWAEKAVPFLLKISAKDNGKPLTAPS
jgi:NAD(P)-dependent dehydrogenase (short-subunit alcohol dehydrogenase family)